ncbi:MAG: DNA polymerase III subunit alpha [Planctomycetota bacterium]|nr:DNA polymerase III subunit alpha [Planctomycetota bacterium]
MKPHPFRTPLGVPEPALQAEATGGGGQSEFPAYAELCVTSNFTFLTGASHPEEYVQQAAAFGLRAIAITDVNSLGGVVRAHVAAKELGIQFVLGARIVLEDAPGVSVCVYPTDMASYRGLCRLLTLGKRRAPKGVCQLRSADLAAHSTGLLAVLTWDDRAQERDVVELGRAFLEDHDRRLWLGASMLYREGDAERVEQIAEISKRLGVPMIATNGPLYHHASRRMLQDVLTCIRLGCTLEQAGLTLEASAERHLKPAHEMHRLFAAYPDALAQTLEVARRASDFSLEQLRYEYPDEVVPAGETPQAYLEKLAWRGAAERFPSGVPTKVRGQIEHELQLISELNYAPYFLTVHDLVRFARTGVEEARVVDPLNTPVAPGWKPILCQGRGAAANSAVCYCLGVTSVDPGVFDLLFERFVSKERNEPPDIDIDFEHERREEVIQYVYRKYGRERAALTAEVITYRRRSAIRDVGKALGLSLDLVDRLAKDVDWWNEGAIDDERFRAWGLNPREPTLCWLARLVDDILGFPRHRSQHVGGFVITRSPLCELVPLENAAMAERTVIEWDKDDIDAVGMLKVDVLGLGMLTALRKCMDAVNEWGARHEVGERQEASGARQEGGQWASGTRHEEDGSARLPLSLLPHPSRLVPSSRVELHTIPAEDPETYAMVQRADTVGVFQIESRAQMSMLPRLKPRTFYDLVIEVAIVRPGPIQGDMVHPYLRRRNGEERVEYVHPAVEEVLRKTLGVPLFQEQCMALAVKAAGFTPGQADQLRRAIAAWKRKGNLIYRFGQAIVEGMMKNGIPREFAERCFEQIKGFSQYGFPESHAASFALLVYASAWLKCHHPAAFTLALLNSQPMGFYAPAQLVRDAKEHGVEVRPVDVNASDWECTLEPSSDNRSSPALRLGMRQVSGLEQSEAQRVRDAVQRHGAFDSLVRLWRVSGAKVKTMRRLASADAFASMGLSRQQALWNARLLRDHPMPLFDMAWQAPAPEGERGPRTEHGDADARHARALVGLDEAPATGLPELDPLRHVTLDYNATGLSLKAHPVSFLRQDLAGRRAVDCAWLRDESRAPDGKVVRVGGLVLVRQRPGTANNVTFMTIEDETGIANLILWYRVYERFRRAALSRLVLVTGRVQRQGLVVHVIVSKVEALRSPAAAIDARPRNFR